MLLIVNVDENIDSGCSNGLYTAITLHLLDVLLENIPLVSYSPQHLPHHVVALIAALGFEIEVIKLLKLQFSDPHK